jgi:hypothetical protein
VPAVVDQVLDPVPSAGLDRNEFLESSMVSANLGSDILTFSVESSDHHLLMRLATEYANTFTEFQRQLDAATVANELKEVRQQLAELEASVEAGSRMLSTRESGRSMPFARASVSAFSDVWLRPLPVFESATT